jgi:hypothetical protein
VQNYLAQAEGIKKSEKKERETFGVRRKRAAHMIERVHSNILQY